MISAVVIPFLLLSLGSFEQNEFELCVQKLTDPNEISFIQNEQINSFNDLITYYNGTHTRYSDSITHSDSILSSEIRDTLEGTMPSYRWTKTEDSSTSDVSSAIPINMQSSLFPQDDILDAVELTGVASSYGGCGPIAMMGVLDYFSRYLGYTEIMTNPTLQSERIQLACDVLNEVTTYQIGWTMPKGTVTYPWDYNSAFNNLMTQYNLNGMISSNYYWTLIGGQKDTYWTIIKNSINAGMPVTLGVGLLSGSGDYTEHYTNIFGYETWYGVDRDTGYTQEFKFIKSRLNWNGYDNVYCCNADILDDGMITLITYGLSHANNYIIYADDFAEEFVNQNGQGQYYFYSISEPVTTDYNLTFQTDRLRCSYIEDQYLVLSPKRSGAGIAYLDMNMPTQVSKLCFDVSLWGTDEQISGETFKLQFKQSGQWFDHITIDLNKISTDKSNPTSIIALFPKSTTQFRFYTNHVLATGERNRGRVVLDSIFIQYH